jgi:hypothetical protein
MYVSRAGVKDFGDRVRIDAYMYDEGRAARMALEKREAKFQAKTGAGGRSSAPRG